MAEAHLLPLKHLLTAYRQSLKVRPAPEVLNALAFRPLGFIVAWGLRSKSVKPIHLVLIHTLLGLFAASAVRRGHDRLAAILLQVVTVLDNADGQLARLRQEETELGRYLDTELDGVVNAALFWAVGYRLRRPGRAALAFAVLTALLSWDFNIEYLYRQVRGEQFRPDTRDEDSLWLALARWGYRLFYQPQDRLTRWVERWCFRQVASRVHRADEAKLAQRWWNRWVAFLSANLGLTTQYVWLGSFLWMRRLERYPTFVLSQVLVPLAAMARRWWAVTGGAKQRA